MPYPRPPRHRRRLALALSTLLTIAAFTAPAAIAGSYTVSGTCLWEPYNASPAQIAVYGGCGSPMIARNAGGNYDTPAGVGGGWRLTAPPGAWLTGATVTVHAIGGNGWQATVFEEGGVGVELVNCPGPSCPGGDRLIGSSFLLSGGHALNARTRCGAPSCSNRDLYGYLELFGAAVTIADTTAPAVSIAGGSLLGGWRGGIGTVTLDTSDNVGVKITRVYIDGALRREENGRPARCNYGLMVPCPNGGATLEVPTGGLADGAHTVSAQAIDSADNAGGSAGVTFYTDNTPPTQPLDVTLDDAGASWRTANKFSLKWRDPPQSFAPIVAAEYELCPTIADDASAAARAEAQRQCVRGTRTGTAITKMEDLSVPKEDAWDARIWLRDGAGNQQPASAVTVHGLNYDITSPSDVAFLPQDAQDPARLRVEATDTGSGIQSGAIEVRRDGEDVWRPLATQVTDYGLTAMLDDETLAKGTYFLRARAADAAGLEQSGDRWQDGSPAMLKLPIRLASRLVAGRAGHRTCRRAKTRGHARRRCHRRLATKPRVPVGRSVRLRGRLTVNRQPAPGADVEVWRQLDGAGDWKRIATATTSKTGRFSYTARRGPARTIRFRYPGTSTIRGRNADVRLRVKATTSITANRRTVINGEYVTIHGHLRGGWIPAGGVLVELQVRARRAWRTFAQPRADATTGRWTLRYRFETVRGGATYKFRANIRRQRGFPFTTGHSRQIRVRVHGL